MKKAKKSGIKISRNYRNDEVVDYQGKRKDQVETTGKILSWSIIAIVAMIVVYLLIK